MYLEDSVRSAVDVDVLDSSIFPEQPCLEDFVSLWSQFLLLPLLLPCTEIPHLGVPCCVLPCKVTLVDVKGGGTDMKNQGCQTYCLPRMASELAVFTQVDDGDVVGGIVLLSMEGGSGAGAKGC